MERGAAFLWDGHLSVGGKAEEGEGSERPPFRLPLTNIKEVSTKRAERAGGGHRLLGRGCGREREDSDRIQPGPVASELELVKVLETKHIPLPLVIATHTESPPSVPSSISSFSSYSTTICYEAAICTLVQAPARLWVV